MRTLSLFEDQRLTLREAIAQSAENLRHYGQFYKHWAIAFSGGKDSTATATLVLRLIKTEQIPRPESLTVLYADTRQELPPLHFSALRVLDFVRELGFDARVVLPEIDKRFWVYILGRGVPPPNNGTLRWCTRQIKVDPMTQALADVRSQLGEGDRLLMLTGVRFGESAARDQRIAVSCTKDGGECGQGWFQSMTADRTDTLAPILHWRVCHVWDWLNFDAPFEGYPTEMVAEAYGMAESDGEEALAMRTGCVGCPLVSGNEDDALARLIKNPNWAYLAPLQRVRLLHRQMRDFRNRLRKDGNERKADGNLVKNPGRVGPLTLEARLNFLEQVLAIQDEVNLLAGNMRPHISLINAEEEARIRELITLKTFPDKWDGSEPGGAELLPEVYQDGSIQNLLFDNWRAASV
jgi:DNA sulfur modification protein DndC